MDVAVDAGHDWDEFVAWTVAEGPAGVDCLSGIPGSVGATPVQNVGAYGQEVTGTIVTVDVLDRRTGRGTAMSPEECRFTYRHSVFKGTNRWVVLRVTSRVALSEPLRFGELSRVLGVDSGGRAQLSDVRADVLKLRAGKGMVLDPDDHDTWSVGAFFTNPVIDTAHYSEIRRRCAETVRRGKRAP